MIASTTAFCSNYIVLCHMEAAVNLELNVGKLRLLADAHCSSNREFRLNPGFRANRAPPCALQKLQASKLQKARVVPALVAPNACAATLNSSYLV